MTLEEYGKQLWKKYSSVEGGPDTLLNHDIYLLASYYVYRISKLALKSIENNVTTNQHTVPDFIIKTFAERQRKGFIIQKFSLSLGNVFTEDFVLYNSLSAVDNIYDNDTQGTEKYLEALLQVVESDVSKIIHRMNVRPYKISVSERITIAMHFIFQHTRNLDSLKAMEHFNDTLDNIKYDFKDIFDENKLITEVEKLKVEKFYHFVLSLLSSGEAFEIVYNRSWNHIILNNGALLSINCPIIYLNEKLWDFNMHALISENLFLPLSNKYVLNISKEGTRDKIMKNISSNHEKFLHDLTLLTNGSRYLYKHPNTKLLTHKEFWNHKKILLLKQDPDFLNSKPKIESIIKIPNFWK